MERTGLLHDVRRQLRLSVRRADVGSGVVSSDATRVDSLLLGNFKLGADGSVAVGPVGAGVSGATTPNLSADLLSFVRAKGLFAGVSLEGAALISRDEWSRAYYGKAVSPTDIVIRREVKNPHSDVLRAEIRKAIEGK